MKTSATMMVSLLAFALASQAQDSTNEFTSQKDKVSYAIGMNIGHSLKQQSYDVDPKVILRGIQDVYTGAETAMTPEDASAALRQYHQELMQKAQAERAKLAEANKKAGAEWLNENAKKEGVVTLPSGLQYKVLEEGNGQPVGSNDTVKVNYRGTLIDGTEFDSSYSRNKPFSFKASGGVIPGWIEAVNRMKVGDKWKIFVPSDLAYGDRGQGRIPPGSTLIFEIELLDATPPQPITSDIIKVPSAEEMAKGAKIETIKASDVEKLKAGGQKAQSEK